MQGWADDVNKAANGAIEIKLFPGGVIADNSNMYDRVTGGVADIGFAVFGPVSSVFPKTNVGTLPFEARNHREDALALWALYEKGIIKDEFTKFHPLAFVVFPGLVIHSKKPIHTLADVKGMKISVEGRVLSEMIPRLGAAPISLQPGELYQSLQRGLVDAVPQGWPSVPTFHLNEVTTFHLEVPLGFNTGYVAMNNDSMPSCRPQARPRSTNSRARPSSNGWLPPTTRCRLSAATRPRRYRARRSRSSTPPRKPAGKKPSHR